MENSWTVGSAEQYKDLDPIVEEEDKKQPEGSLLDDRLLTLDERFFSTKNNVFLIVINV